MKHAAPATFLQSVAQFFSAGAYGRPKAENIVYVLPNKRSALFMKHYVHAQVTDVALMPRFMTMRTFLSLHSPFPEADRLEQLYILYDAYREAMAQAGHGDTSRDFDSFIFWGEMILSDFDDIDRSLANAEKLFGNLKNNKNLVANYLDDEQKEVVRRIWGESRLTADTEEFWLNLDSDREDSVTARFLYLWQILGDIYKNFQRRMDGRKLSSVGAQYRQAVEAIRKLSREDFGDTTHYAFVGFNDLSIAETLIFNRLKDLGVASFFWDTAPLRLCEPELLQNSRPLKRLADLVRNFPAPADYEVPLPTTTPHVTVVAVPSNTGQAKGAGNCLREWHEGEGGTEEKTIETAVILPDQSLLVPTLTSIPENIKSVNISMGLPYRTTTFAGLIHSIISMQLRARSIGGRMHFFYADVDAVISHPHIMALASAEADRLRTRITDERLYNIAADEICDSSPALRAVFTPVRSLQSAADVADYLRTLLDWLGTELDTRKSDARAANGFEVRAIQFFRDQVDYIARLTAEHGVEMSERTFLHLFERVFNSRGLSVNGAPLKGLQILGVLETRALDFRNVVVESMNERIFPRKQYTRTMIPNNLRVGYGLPDFESLEWTYAYCFYRLISRAEQAVLFYDSRGDGLGGGEMSRYISQMHYLMPTVKMTFKNITYGAESSGDRTITVPKDEKVLRLLDGFKPGGRLKLSASAIKDFLNCPLSFYLKYVRNMRGSDDIVDYISAAQYGSAVHGAIQALYEGHRGQLIDRSVLSLYTDPESPAVVRAARVNVVQQRYRSFIGREDEVLPAEGEIAVEIVARIVAASFRAEIEAYPEPYTFVESEWKLPPNAVWKIDDELSVNFKMSVDRVDRLDAHRLRFVDFKTGSESITTKDFDLLFMPGADHSVSGFRQLLIYCEAYRAVMDPAVDIVPVLYPLRALSKGEPIQLFTCGEEIVSYAKIADTVRPKIHAMIKRIFDPSEAFGQCADAKQCKFCPFTRLCGRVVPDNV
ncbi:MAG: hypothetical protein HDS72_09275 [Bacteroidales bacterium]|nr:hypothetical protein [Bacteroidales bacterium]